MGFSVSASFAIFLLGFLIISTMAYSSLSNTLRMIDDARREEHDRMMKELHTDIEITGKEYDGANMTIYVENTGTIVLDPYELNVLIDGEIRSYTPSSDVWVPGENLTITVYSVPDGAIKVVTENGISDYYT